MTIPAIRNPPAKLLVIDDEPLILDCFRYLFPPDEVAVVTASSASEGLRQLAAEQPDVVIVDIGLPDMTGLDAFRQIREVDLRVPVILMTGRGTAATAIEAMSLGAFEYVVKPLDPDSLCKLLSMAFNVSRMMRIPAKVPQEGVTADADAGSSDLLIGQCPAMQDVYKAIGRIAVQDVTALILGDSGTGKELAARAIYHYSRRSQKPFLAINCASIPENLLESELFGHEKGAFTGAERRRIGKFEQCHGGTLFLDEVGDMSPMTQTKVLRVLQEQTFERVGGNETIRVDVRVIAATNRDLDAMIAAGTFRRDLHYRLNVFTIRLPRLQDRGDDVLLLARSFLKRYSREFGKEMHDFSPDTIALLQQYPWPGNVRELQSVVKQSILEAMGPVIIPDFLPLAMRPADAVTAPPVALNSCARSADLEDFINQRMQAGTTNLHGEALVFLERILLMRVLEQTAGNISQAARILGITRPTLRAKLVQAGLSLEKSLTDAANSPTEG